MLDLEKFKVIGMMAARQARARAVEPGVTSNEIIAMAPLLKVWTPGVYAANDVVVYDGVPYRVVSDHDSTGNDTWNPIDAASLFAAYHATEVKYALQYQTPTGQHDAYMNGEYIVWTDGLVYMCNIDYTVYDPGVLPSAWKVQE